MKIKRFKLKDNIARDDLIALGFKSGGSWIKKDAELFMSRCFEDENSSFEYSISIAFSSDINNWNDFDNVLIMDEDFGQPYTPFYNLYEKEVDGFPILENVIFKYNDFMSRLGIFEELKV